MDDAFHGRIHALARNMEKPVVDDQVQEDALKIRSLHMVDGLRKVQEIVSPDGVAARLFIESEAALFSERPGKIRPDKDTVVRAIVFFGEEKWEDEPNTGKHPLIDAIRAGNVIVITWKL